MASAGILELVAAVELRRRQIEQAGLVLIDQAAALLGARSSPAPAIVSGAPQPRRLPLDHGERVARLRARRPPARRA